MQRTRSSASPPHSPLTRHTLGGNRRQFPSLASGSVVLALVACLLASVLGATDEEAPPPPPGCEWREIPGKSSQYRRARRLAVSRAAQKGKHFGLRGRTGWPQHRSPLEIALRVALSAPCPSQHRGHSSKGTCTECVGNKEVDSTPLEEESIGVVTLSPPSDTSLQTPSGCRRSSSQSQPWETPEPGRSTQFDSRSLPWRQTPFYRWGISSFARSEWMTTYERAA